MKTIINLIELYALAWFTWKAFRLFAGKRGKGTIGKLFTLTSRGINHRLDAALKKQREVQGYGRNVIQFKKKAHGRA